MKKLMLICTLFLLGMACSDKEEPVKPQFDPPHYEIHIQLFNEETGNSLLDPMYGYLVKDNVWVTCGNGEVYQLSFFNDYYYNPNAPFRLEQYIESGGWRYRAVIDRYTIDDSFLDVLVIYWGDVLNFETEIWVGAEVDFSTPEPTISRSMTVDGEPVTCEDDENWNVVIKRKIPKSEPADPGDGVRATGIWQITDLEALLNGTPITSYAPENALFANHWLVDPISGEFLENEVMTYCDVELDGKRYSILIPLIYIKRDEDAWPKCQFSYGEIVSNIEMLIDEEPQIIKDANIEGYMYWDYSDSATSNTPKPLVLLAPQTDYYSNIGLYVEWENGTLELQINYLRVIGGYDLPF